MGVVGAVGVVDDAGAGVGGDAVLVDDPFEGGAVAEAVVEGGGGDAAQEQEIVVAEFGFVFRVEAHLFDAEGDFGLGVFDLFKLEFCLFFIVDVEFHEALAGGGKGVEVGREGDAGEFALEVGGVASAVFGMVEDSVGGVEDVPLSNRVVGVVDVELGKAPSQ